MRYRCGHPAPEATPDLADKIPITARRDKDNRWQFKGFPGGFLKFVGSNSPSSVKSTPAPMRAYAMRGDT